ncbi:hypothetical protein EU538_12715 [Candidatus Thorarchaeota archaeon]|jgi:hypothetical protein|nr:MAG: hypothetical protein EU538_12715 [Candidatus Thorarchaeota archaeon]
MGAKAEGAAQGFTLLGAIVLVVFALFQLLIPGVNAALGGSFDGVINAVLGIALLLMALLGIDACGFIYWKIRRSGAMLALFGFLSIVIVGRGLNFDILSWLQNIGMFAGLMLLIAGILILTRSSPRG